MVRIELVDDTKNRSWMTLTYMLSRAKLHKY